MNLSRPTPSFALTCAALGALWVSAACVTAADDYEGTDDSGPSDDSTASDSDANPSGGGTDGADGSPHIDAEGFEQLPGPLHPEFRLSMGGRVYFTAAADGPGDDQLWTTDGTSHGTQLLYDRGSECCGSIRVLGGAEDLIFFLSDDRPVSRLGVTDGTPAGTRAAVELGGLVRDVIGTVGRRIVFAYEPDGSGNRQLWASDGTPEGTHALSSEPEPFQGVFATIPTVWRGRLYFFAGFDDWAADARPRLYSTDGSSGDLEALTDLPVDRLWTPAGAPLVPFGDALYFRGHDEAHGSELWQSDGSPAGTRMVANLAPDTPQPLGSNPYIHAATPRGLLFESRYSSPGSGGLWRSDGTTGGTEQIADVDLDVFTPFAAVAGQWFFTARTPSASPGGFALWLTNGESSGTRRVSAAVDPSVSRRQDTNWGATTAPTWDLPMKALGDRLLFAGKTAEHPVAPWASDGTESGTEQLADAYFWFPNFTPVGDKAYFVADLNGRGNEDRQLFVTDGTRAGTRVVAPVGATQTEDPFGENNSRMVALGGALVLTADFDGAGRKLWVLHPTP